MLKRLRAAAGHRAHVIVKHTILADTNNVNLFSLFGNPTISASYILTIDTGVVIGSTSSTLPSLDTGSGWHPDSSLTIINNGDVNGRGGNGGRGGNIIGFCEVGSAGQNGGSAINATIDTTIDNTNGNIFGGGGGGGGGGGTVQEPFSTHWAYGGGGGGGGQGVQDSTAGSGGIATSGGINYNGTAGTNGTIFSFGTGGNGGNSDATSNHGGNAGVWGAAGVAGATALTIYDIICRAAGGASGGGGKAIALNSNNITWLGGNNSTQVKGAVS